MMLRTPPRSKRPAGAAEELTAIAASPSPPLKRPRMPSPLPLVPARPLDFALSDFPSCDPDLHIHGHDSDSLQCSYTCRQMVKSELLETLDYQEKKILELSSKVESLENVTHVAELEKEELLDRVRRLEQETAAASALENAVQKKYILEMEQAEKRLRTQLKRCNDLEIELQKEMRQRVEAEKKADASEIQLNLLKESSDKAAEASKREIVQLEDSLRKLQKDANFNISRTKMEHSAEKNRAQFAEAETQALKTQCEGLQKRLSETLDEKCDLEQKLAMTNPSLSPSDNQELESIVKHLKDELRHCEADVAEARKLKQFHRNADLLKEKLESERQRADRAEAALGDLANLQLQVESLQKELQSWTSLIHELPDVKRRDDIPKKIADLQREAMSTMARVGEMAAQIIELQVSLEKVELARSEAEKSASLSREEVNKMGLEITRLTRKAHLLMKERDGLKSIISSYDEEEAVILKGGKPGATVEALDILGNAKEKRIYELEALVVDLQKEGDLLRSELAKAEMRLGRGDYDPLSTKVVHMVENLDINSEKQVLILEIQSLREKLDILQKKNTSSGTADTVSAEVSLLWEQVNSLEKRETRYKKVFAEKISVFRQACCLLFGYMVQMSEEQHLSTGMTVTLFTLQSIYAQSDEEKLEFQFESNQMNLVANEYTSSPEITRMVDVYLQKFKSIPAFTANLTSELFSKATMS